MGSKAVECSLSYLVVEKCPPRLFRIRQDKLSNLVGSNVLDKTETETKTERDKKTT